MDNVQKLKQRFGITGNYIGLNRAIDIAVQVAPTDLSVLISGDSGTGKEVFPQIIHQYSARKHGQYIAVNCGAIPEGTIDSELFGHEKGSFTGATDSRKGYFEVANGGTIFLDEVAELPLATHYRTKKDHRCRYPEELSARLPGCKITSYNTERGKPVILL